jgi:Glycosyl transferase family 2
MTPSEFIGLRVLENAGRCRNRATAIVPLMVMEKGKRANVQNEPGGRVSLTIIVRDEQENLPRCFESVRGVFDEIVVLNTGSKVRTVEIARSFGTRVLGFITVTFSITRDNRLITISEELNFDQSSVTHNMNGNKELC